VPNQIGQSLQQVVKTKSYQNIKQYPSITLDFSTNHETEKCTLQFLPYATRKKVVLHFSEAED